MWHAQLNSEHQLICVAKMPLFVLLAWGPPLQIYGLHKLPDSCANSLLARASGNYRGIEEHCAALMCCKLLKVKYCPSSFIFFYCASWVKWLLQTIYEVVHQPINPSINFHNCTVSETENWSEPPCELPTKYPDMFFGPCLWSRLRGMCSLLTQNE